MPYPRANKDDQIPTLCPASPPPAGFTLIGALHDNVTCLRYFGTTRSMQVAPIPQIKFSNLNDYVMNKSTVQMQHF